MTKKTKKESDIADPNPLYITDDQKKEWEALSDEEKKAISKKHIKHMNEALLKSNEVLEARQ